MGFPPTRARIGSSRRHQVSPANSGALPYGQNVDEQSRWKECIAAVLREPDSDAPRRALAELYAESGDARAEFIDVQLQLESLPVWDSKVPALRKIEKRLLENNKSQWAVETGCVDLRPSFRRGLAYCVEGTAKALCAELNGVAARAPIANLLLAVDEEETGPDPDLQRLVELDSLQNIRALELFECDLGPDSLSRLIAHPNWKKLEILRLGSGTCELKFMEALARIELPPALVDLRLNENMGGIGDEGVLALAQAPWFHRLRRLELVGQSLTDDSLFILAEFTENEKLEHLDLASIGYADNDLTDEGLRDLADGPWFPNLRVLGLHGCAVGGAIPSTFARARNLHTANLSRTGLDADKLRFISAMEVWPRLKELNLGGNPLGDDGAEFLAQCSSLPAVLDLKSCEIGTAGLVHLSRAPEVSALDLRGNSIETEAWSDALAADRLPKSYALATDAHDWPEDLVAAIEAHYPRTDLAGVKRGSDR